MKVTLPVLKVGCGVMQEEGQADSKWAKLYSVDTNFVNDEMFTGIKEVDYSICHPETMLPNLELAEAIKEKLRAKKVAGLVELTFEISHKVTAKKSQMVVIGVH